MAQQERFIHCGWEGDMVRYILTCQQPHRHYIRFNAVFPTQQDYLDLQLPSWRPGRYELGNFARNVRGAVATCNGMMCRVEKRSKDLWRIHCPGGGQVHWSYEYYAAEINAGSSFLDGDVLYINPVNCFFFDVAQPDQAYEVILELPDDFVLATSLECSGPMRMTAATFDELADSPFVASPQLETWSYDSNGVQFYVHLLGTNKPEKERLLRDFKSFTGVHFDLFETIPCASYHFLFLFPEIAVRHGVEHQSSTVIAMGPSSAILEEDRYRELLGISCHELFHTWNVKFIRPQEMKPYDFTRENYSRSGFVYEGVTTYYGDLLLWRSGVFTDEQYLNVLATTIRTHLENDGRFSLSVSDSSFDTWLDGYVAGAPWRKVSIYNEGCLIAFICDAWLLRETDGSKSLDDVMRKLYADALQGSGGYSVVGYQRIMEETGGTSFSEIFTQLVSGTSDYMPFVIECLDQLGIKLSFTEHKDWIQSLFGMRGTRQASGQFLVETVLLNSPADRGGIARGDIIISVPEHYPHKDGETLGWALDFLSFGVQRSTTLVPDETRYFRVPKLEVVDPDHALFRKWKFRK